MPDRSVPPPIHTIDKIKLPKYEKYHLSNGIPVYAISAGTQQVVKFEWVFLAGRSFEQKRMTSAACSHMLREGTAKYNSSEISSLLDFYGASLHSKSGMDTSAISLYCMKKHFKDVIPVIREILENSIFPEHELDQYKHHRKQQLSIELAKNEVIAYRTLTEKIFGERHPYGYNSEVSSYDDLSKSDITNHYNSLLGHTNSFIVLSGCIDEEVKRDVDIFLSDFERNVKSREELPSISGNEVGNLAIQSKNSYQTSIRIGCAFGNRDHPDYMDMAILNTLLGGYFGSRLMKNIREDKAYTYNIYSSLDTFKFDGYFYISTDVGNAYAEPTLSEIKKEMDLLKMKSVPESELHILRNYLLGNILTMLDGPLNAGRVLKNLLVQDLDEEYFARSIDCIRSINPKSLKETALKYLDLQKMWTISVGKEEAASFSF